MKARRGLCLSMPTVYNVTVTVTVRQGKGMYTYQDSVIIAVFS